MNYEKIYNSLIQKRRVHKIDRTPETPFVEYHHIIPISCGGENTPGRKSCNSEKYNLVGLTTREHFFAHLLLHKIYKEKYGEDSWPHINMLKAISFMVATRKYDKQISSRLYEQLRNEAIKNNAFNTTDGKIWVTNNEVDLMVSPDQIPEGFHKGRIIAFTEQEKKAISKKISEGRKGRGLKSWNSGKRGVYSDEYRRKISENHADFSGEKNGRYGSRSMINLTTGDRKLVKKEQIEEFLQQGYIIKRSISQRRCKKLLKLIQKNKQYNNTNS